MIDLSMQDIVHVKALARIEAQKTKRNQVIINSYAGRYRVYRIIREDQWDGQIVSIVRYTPENKRGNVLRDNGDAKPRTVKGKGTKGKSGKTK